MLTQSVNKGHKYCDAYTGLQTLILSQSASCDGLELSDSILGCVGGARGGQQLERIQAEVWPLKFYEKGQLSGAFCL